ncbi:MAG: hypothetical protein ACOC47_08165 [Alkalispirochaetaceae bacterium]
MLFLLGISVQAQTLLLEMQIRGAESFSSRESDFVRATADGILETFWDAGFIVYDSSDPGIPRKRTSLPNLVERARDGGAELLLLIELMTDRPDDDSPLTPHAFRYRLISVREGVPIDSGTAAVANMISESEVDEESYWLTLGGMVGREVLNAQ